MSQHITAQAYITNSGPKQKQPYGFCRCSRPEGGCTCRSPPPSAFPCGAGEDFDMTEYEVLRFDQRDSEGSPSEATPASSPDSSPDTLSLTPLPSPSSTPSPPSPPSTPSPPPTPPAPERPEEVGGRGAQAASSSPQLRLAKRKAPEVHVLVHVAAQLLPASNCPPTPSPHHLSPESGDVLTPSLISAAVCRHKSSRSSSSATTLQTHFFCAVGAESCLNCGGITACLNNG